MINMALNFEGLMLAFFGLGDDVDFHCIECCLVSGSYIQVSSQVIIEFNKSGSFSMHYEGPNTIPCNALFVHLTALLELFLHRPFSRSIPPLEFVEHFPSPN